MRGLHWFRNDLRLRDNAALTALCVRVDEWLPVFVLDPRLCGSAGSGEARTRFLLDCLGRLQRDLEKRGIPLLVRRGEPEAVLPRLLAETGARHLSFGEDSTPFARERDDRVRRRVEKDGVSISTALDHVVHRSAEIRTGTGGRYAVYTPYKNKWWEHWRDDPRLPISRPRLPAAIPGYAAETVPSPAELGIPKEGIDLPTGGEDAARRRLDGFLDTAAERYHTDRDRPAIDGTSRLSPYLRFGVISARQCIARGEEAARAERRLRQGVGKWLDELVWRDFYAGILEANPRVLRGNHRREFDDLVWNDDADGFAAWCEGRTGYPIVDAGMRQLRETGWMHNRVRMIVASFLTKDLLIDWRHGERFFFDHLVDGDPASNNGGWQWAASTGTDAQPWFRIFNPVSQGRRFDPRGAYVRRFLPELAKLDDRHVHAPWLAARPPDDYPAPILDHAERRKLCLERFGALRRT